VLAVSRIRESNAWGTAKKKKKEKKKKKKKKKPPELSIKKLAANRSRRVRKTATNASRPPRGAKSKKPKPGFSVALRQANTQTQTPPVSRGKTRDQ